MTGKRKAFEIPSTAARPSVPDPVMEELGLSAPAPTAPVGPAPSSPVSTTAEVDRSTRPRMTSYISAEVQEAARAAVWWTRNEQHGYENLSDLVEDALLDKIKQLSDQYNGGEPFAPLPAGRRLRRGRPLSR